MSQTFNLISEPWIPCILPDGALTELGLRDTLARAHHIQEIRDSSPLVTVSLHRLLLAVLHRVFGPADREEWLALWGKGSFDQEKLDSYWEKWKHRFDLYDEKYPFYQVAGFETNEQDNVNKLALELSSKNTVTLFDHSLDKSSFNITHAQASRCLLTIQGYALGGGISRKPLNSNIKTPNFFNGPMVNKAIIMLKGNSLWETLLLNLIWNWINLTNDIDSPAWEKDEKTEPIERFPTGCLDYLSWQSRMIRFVPPEISQLGPKWIYFTVGYEIPNDYETFDPFVYYKRDEKLGFVPLTLKSERALWRDSGAILAAKYEGDRGDKRPGVLDQVGPLVLDDNLPQGKDFRFMVFGLSKVRGRAEIKLWRHEEMPLPLSYLKNEHLAGLLQHELKLAEDIFWIMRQEIWSLARSYLAPQKETQVDSKTISNLVDSFPSSRYYWSSLEIPFREMYLALPSDRDKAQIEWRENLRKEAVSAFDLAVDNLGTSAWALKAGVIPRIYLQGRIKKELKI